MRAGIVVIARMGSTRFPGKVLAGVMGRPLLSILLERLKRVRRAELIVVATSDHDRDAPIADLARSEGVEVFRGDEDDWVARIVLAARAFDADPVVRVTADCPLVDPATVDAVIHALDDGDCDFVTADLVASYPIGMGCAGVRRAALDRLYETTRGLSPEDAWGRLRMREAGFHAGTIPCPANVSHHRWTVDEPADLELVSRIVNALYPAKPAFTLADILALMDRHPEWAAINRHVRQKTGPHAWAREA